jgi:hypothetical protein
VEDSFALFILLSLANAAPLLAALALGPVFAQPLDGGRRWRDGRPLFGPTKTWRGLGSALILTPPVAALLGHGWVTGLMVASGAMAGDLLVSFFKRRRGLASSASVPVVDQAVETLLPAVLVRARMGVGWFELVLAVLVFTVADLMVTPLLKRLAAARSGHHGESGGVGAGSRGVVRQRSSDRHSNRGSGGDQLVDGDLRQTVEPRVDD